MVPFLAGFRAGVLHPDRQHAEGVLQRALLRRGRAPGGEEHAAAGGVHAPAGVGKVAGAGNCCDAHGCPGRAVLSESETF